MFRLRNWTACLLVSLALAACGGAPAATLTSTPTSSSVAPATSSTAKPTAPTATATVQPATEATTSATTALAQTAPGTGSESDGEIKAAIQKTVDSYDAAYNEVDQAKLLAALDQKNLALRRALVERFQAAASGQSSGAFDLQEKIDSIKAHGKDYYLATILALAPQGNGKGQSVRTMVFRKVDGKWLITEPKRSDLGKKLSSETEHFIVEYYEWDKDIVPQMDKVVEDAYTTVKQKLGKAPAEKVHAFIAPTNDLFGSGAFTAAFYIAGPGGDHNRDRLMMRSPQSLGFGAYDAQEGFQPEFEHTVTHEFTHLVVDRLFGGNARLAGGFGWMSEGIAEHVAGNFYPSTIINAIQTGTLLPIKDKSGAIEKDDLENFYLHPDKHFLGQAQGSELVDFIYIEKGGYDGWWHFVDIFAKSQNIEEAVKEDFGMSLDQFETKYHDFMKKKYHVQ